MEQIKLVIADDHAVLRQSMALALRQEPNFCIVGQAPNGKVLLDIVELERPDIILLDLEMPVMDGWTALDHLQKNYPSCKVIIVSMHVESLSVKELVARGAKGFLSKSADFKLLIDAIYDVSALGYFFNKTVPSRVLQELLVTKAINPLFKKLKLNESEQLTLNLICQDKPTKEIATILDVSERTVERYKTRLYEKTKAKTSAGLILFALKNNLFSLG